MKRDLNPISEFLPPQIRAALVLAAASRDSEAITALTDQAAKQYPELVLPRTTCRPEFTPRERGMQLLAK
jgi:hypothetical protein